MSWQFNKCASRHGDAGDGVLPRRVTVSGSVVAYRCPWCVYYAMVSRHSVLPLSCHPQSFPDVLGSDISKPPGMY